MDFYQSNFLNFAYFVSPGVLYTIFRDMYIPTDKRDFLKILTVIVSIGSFFMLISNGVLIKFPFIFQISHNNIIIFSLIYIVVLPFIFAFFRCKYNEINEFLYNSFYKRNNFICKFLAFFLKILNYFFPLRHLHATPWDFLLSKNRQPFLIIKMKNGEKIGGSFCSESYVSEYPFPQQIYLHSVYELNSEDYFYIEKTEDGNYLPIKRRDYGVLLNMKDIDLIRYYFNK